MRAFCGRFFTTHGRVPRSRNDGFFYRWEKLVFPSPRSFRLIRVAFSLFQVFIYAFVEESIGTMEC